MKRIGEQVEGVLHPTPTTHRARVERDTQSCWQQPGFPNGSDGLSLTYAASCIYLVTVAPHPLSTSGRSITSVPAANWLTEPALKIRVEPSGALASASSMLR